MNNAPLFLDTSNNSPTLFENIANDIESKGYSINPNAIPAELLTQLYDYFMQMHNTDFHQAGIGRGRRYARSRFVRTDKICWIHGQTPACKKWLDWSAQLQRYLNMRLFLGLFSFESHFAHYKKGDFYKLHFDAFKGEANRVLSLVVYLNPSWQLGDGGELVIYSPANEVSSVKVTPLMGTLVVFLSEEFPHEVLVTQKDRYSIAGWYRLNTNTHHKVDPNR